MKYIILSCSFSLLAMPAFAQEHNHHQHHKMSAKPKMETSETYDCEIEKKRADRLAKEHQHMHHMTHEAHMKHMQEMKDNKKAMAWCAASEQALAKDKKHAHHTNNDAPPAQKSNSNHQHTEHHDQMNHGDKPHASTSSPATQEPPDTGLWRQAGAYWGKEEMAASRHHVMKHHGDTPNFMVMAERLEWLSANDGSVLFDGQAWYGGDINKLWLKSEAHVENSEFEELEVQALWSRAISTYFDLQAGVKFDIDTENSDNSNGHLVLGVQGLAPYLFEVDAATFLSQDGDLTARAEIEYELLFTQKLILQPRMEISASAQEIRNDLNQAETGAGLTHASIGARLRYEVKREVAPYIGVEWNSALGDTASIRTQNGQEIDSVSAIIGLRMWY